MNIIYQLLSEHLVSGQLKAGNKIAIKIDQTLTQDSTGTMVYLQLEEMGIDRIKTDLSLAYCDHQLLQQGFENMDDHLYLQSVTAKYGIVFSKPGNGICHQLHLERFAKPGCSLLGSDSHTPNAGGIGALAIGAGGLDVACAMAGEPFNLIVPKVIKVELINKLQPGVSAKDIILHLLQLLKVTGNVNTAIEYSGEGVKKLSVTQRATITNMGTELGVTTSIFPSDYITEAFLISQNRKEDYREIKASKEAVYDKEITIDLAKLEALTACPHMPDNIKKVKELMDIKVNQVIIGSCTNSSYDDIMGAVSVLKGKTVHPEVSLAISCGSKSVLTKLSENGSLAVLLKAGARVLENACGPCIGMGLAPNSKGVSLRTFNRNFKGRSGTEDALVYLVSPQTAAASAIKGYIVEVEDFNYQENLIPEKVEINDSLFIQPDYQDKIIRGKNIIKLPINKAVDLPITQKVLLKLGDNITTDDILPAGAQVLPYRSNLPKISEFTFLPISESFNKKAKENNGGIIIAGENYGQGSSREHAAMVVKYLGVDLIIAKSFARIHLANLINSGVLPLVFKNPQDYDLIKEDNVITIDTEFNLISKETNIKLDCLLSPLELEIVKLGGLLNQIRNKKKGE